MIDFHKLLIICLCPLSRVEADNIPHFSVRTQSAERPVIVNDEPQLLIDDYLIAHSSNLVKATTYGDTCSSAPRADARMHRTRDAAQPSAVRERMTDAGAHGRREL